MRYSIKENKTLLIVIVVGLLLLELEVFALAAMKSGRKSWLQIIDAHGDVIHETNGTNLSDFNKYYFEKTFGPLKNYHMRLKTVNRPFPFRAWFVAAIGIPVGVMLLFGFVVKAYSAIFHGGGGPGEATDPARRSGMGGKLDDILHRISRLNIFIIGFLIFIGAISFWVVPNFITYLGRAGIEAVIRFKWVFIVLGAVVVGIGMWIVYLRYLLAKKSIDSQTEIEKHRLSLEYQGQYGSAPQLEASAAHNEPRVSLGWDEADKDQRPAGDSG